MKITLTAFHQSDPFKARQIVKKYAKEVVLPLLIIVKKKTMNVREEYGLSNESIMEIGQPSEYLVEE